VQDWNIALVLVDMPLKLEKVFLVIHNTMR